MKYSLRLFLAFLAGMPTTLAFAPFNYWPVALITPIFLLLLLNNQSTKRAIGVGFFWGAGFFSTGITWLFVTIDTFGDLPVPVSIFITALLVIYIASFYGLFAGLLNYFFPTNNRRRLLIAAPILWVLCEWFRGWLFTGFPWAWLGYSQINSPLSGFAPVSGVSAISFTVLLIAASLTYAILHKKWGYSVISLLVLVFGFALTKVDWVTPDPDTRTKFALVQGNVSLDIKWDPAHQYNILFDYLSMTQHHWDADIIVWPETAVPEYDASMRPFLQEVDGSARENNTALLTGILGLNKDYQPTNDIINLGVNGLAEYNFDLLPRYSKYHLLPFGEFVPFESVLRQFGPLFNLPQSSFSRGDYVQNNFIANNRHLLMAICFEMLFGEQLRDNITDETDFIVTVSNDAWFDNTIGPKQHMQINQMRALELGKPVIRSTNTGITAVTDHKGQIIAKLPQQSADVLAVEVTSTKGSTPYRQLGDWLLYIWSVLGLALAFLGCKKRA